MKVFIAQISASDISCREIEVTSMENIERLAGCCGRYVYAEITDAGNDNELVKKAKEVLSNYRTPGSQMIRFLSSAINSMVDRKVA